MRIAIINGPNLNLTGSRQPDIYGTMSFDEFIPQLCQRFANQGIEISYRQSNHEGQLIDWLQEAQLSADGVVLNAAAYTHTSIAIADTVAAIGIPVVEVHISDIMKREIFRRYSYLTDVCVHTIIGRGMEGYAEAIEYLARNYGKN